MDVIDDPGRSRDEEKSKPIIRKSYRSCFAPSSDSGSALSSPICGSSELGSSSTEETESDQDDDYFAELTRQMAQHMLPEEDDGQQKQRQFNFKTWDLVDSTQEFENCDKITSPSVEPCLTAAEIQAKQALIDEQIRVFRLYKLNKAEQQQQQPDSFKQAAVRVQFPAKTVPWVPNLADQTRNGSEMRAVLLGGHGPGHHQIHSSSGSGSGSKSNRFSSGTGVFLPPAPRITNSAPAESRKKSGRSTTVLMPERVVQALRLHYVSVASKMGAAGFPPQLGGTGDVRYSVELQEKSQQRMSTSSAPAVDCHREFSLPPEWTY